MFRFTIRELLWLMVVVALGVAWWVDRGRLAEKVEQWEKCHMPGMLAPPYIMERELEFQRRRPAAEVLEENRRMYEWEHRKDNWRPIEMPNPTASAPNPPKD